MKTKCQEKKKKKKRQDDKETKDKKMTCSKCGELSNKKARLCKPEKRAF